MNLKPPLTFEQQIERLKKHGMIIDNEKSALEMLSKVNYYRLSGYFIQFRKEPKNSDLIKGTSFSKICEIYNLDEELRSFLRIYLEKVEIYFRTQISYYFSKTKCNETPYDQHYDENNFWNKKGFAEITNSFKTQKNYYRDSLILQHHNKIYGGKMPLWVIVEFLSFSNLSKLYNAMYLSEKDVIAKASGTGSEMLSNNLHCLSVFRNRCAHGTRLYNTIFSPPAKFNSSFLRNNKNIKQNTFFAYFLTLLKRLPDSKSKKECVDSFIHIISKYKADVDLSLLGISGDYESIIKLVIL